MNEIELLIKTIETLIPEYIANQDDLNITGGNIAVCIIDEENNVYGKLFGSDKNRTRQSYKIAWIKASQVWITGYKTGEYESLVYSKQIDNDQWGIMLPDLIGWEGGQPITLKSGKKLSVGFSGFRGISDLEIVVRAIKIAKL